MPIDQGGCARIEDLSPQITAGSRLGVPRVNSLRIAFAKDVGSSPKLLNFSLKGSDLTSNPFFDFSNPLIEDVAGAVFRKHELPPVRLSFFLGVARLARVDPVGDMVWTTSCCRNKVIEVTFISDLPTAVGAGMLKECDRFQLLGGFGFGITRNLRPRRMMFFTCG